MNDSLGASSLMGYQLREPTSLSIEDHFDLVAKLVSGVVYTHASYTLALW